MGPDGDLVSSGLSSVDAGASVVGAAVVGAAVVGAAVVGASVGVGPEPSDSYNRPPVRIVHGVIVDGE